MKYKVGDRVRVKEGLKGGERYGGLHFAQGMEGCCGKVYTVDTITNAGFARLSDGSVWVFNDAMLEPSPFGKSDLKTGMRTRYRDGGERIVLKNDDEMVFTCFDGKHSNGNDYAEDLTNLLKFSDLDIIEVLRPKRLDEALDEDCELISVWKRDEVPIEITIAEIAELKGVSPERIRIKED